jgi:hypothetical protein
MNFAFISFCYWLWIHTLDIEHLVNHWRISCLEKDFIQAFVRQCGLILEINKMLLQFEVLGIQLFVLEQVLFDVECRGK